jgi:glycosyltransferase involved in cell wall biosynthesis
MNIGFDAKRAFHNQTGLGHYSRSLINGLAQYFPSHRYFLFNPRPSTLYQPKAACIEEVLPTRPLHKWFRSAWRSSWVKNDLKKHGIDLYHGLSHEIPLGIQRTGIPSVVTMHDLIFERYPEQYGAVDVRIYRKKFRYACTHATRIIAISEQTKKDLVHFYEVPENKIEVCYQGCHPAFAQKIASDEKKRVQKLYALPDKFFLYVGSVIERKNLLTICKGLYQVKEQCTWPLVVIGSGGAYKEKVKEYIKKKGMEDRVFFLSDQSSAKSSAAFQSGADFPAIYQQAEAMIYPSVYEGFGIPVLEALWSRLPVITSNTSCLPETGGDAALYIDPLNEEQMAQALLHVARDETLRLEMIDRGWQHAHQFTTEKTVASVMMVYNQVYNKP